MRRPGYLRALFAAIIAVCVALVLLAMSRSSAQVSVGADYSTPSGAQTTPPGTRLISLQTKDLIVDPSSQAIYASVPGTGGAAANSLTKIDPVAGSVGISVFVGSDPGRLAISDDQQFIYADLDGEGGVRRFDVSSQTPQLKFSLGRNLRDGVNVLADWAEKGLKIVVVTQQLELNGVIGRTIPLTTQTPSNKRLSGPELLVS